MDSDFEEFCVSQEIWWIEDCVNAVIMIECVLLQGICL